MCIIKLLKAGDKMEKWNCLNPINLEYDIIVIYIYIVSNLNPYHTIPCVT